MEVARVGVEHRHLALAGAHDVRVRVTDVRDVVDRVEVGAAEVVEQVGADAAGDPQRVGVGHAEVGAEQATAVGEGLARRRGARARRRSSGSPSSRAGSGDSPRNVERLRRHGDAGVVHAEVEQVEDHLAVHVRRPVAVARRRPDPADDVAGGDRVALAQVRERLDGEVAVERPERDAVVGRVLEHDHRAVVERRVVVVHVHDPAGPRRVQRGAGVGPQVGAEVDGATLRGRVVGGRELRGRVEQPGLGVAADSDRVGVAVDVATDEDVEPLGPRADVLRGEQVAAHRQVERRTAAARPTAGRAAAPPASTRGARAPPPRDGCGSTPQASRSR